MGWELDFLNWIHSFSCPFLDSVMLGFTYAATAGVLWIAIGLSLLLMRTHRRAGLVLLVALGLSYIISDLILKPAVGRTRPCEFADFEMLIPAPDSFSFPSGHTMSSFTAATVLAVFFRRWAPATLGFAAMVGLSRLYLFVHWPTDVIFGALFGIVLSLSVVWLTGRLFPSEKDAGKEGTPSP